MRWFGEGGGEGRGSRLPKLLLPLLPSLTAKTGAEGLCYLLTKNERARVTFVKTGGIKVLTELLKTRSLEVLSLAMLMLTLVSSCEATRALFHGSEASQVHSGRRQRASGRTACVRVLAQAGSGAHALSVSPSSSPSPPPSP